ncbi:MAG TPA: nucleotidyltransferase [Candidatus Binatia bacterium]
MTEPLPACEFYRDILDVLDEAKIPILIGGAFAQEYFTGISRDTKDLDLFILESDVRRALDALQRAGYRPEIKFSHWLAKAYDKDGIEFVDIIFNSGNGLCKVDRTWFEHAPAGEMFGKPARYCPVEESIWQKAFIMERERYDGADIAHLLRAQGDKLDWYRLLRRFGEHWRVLFSCVTLFGYIYPAERTKIPDWLQRHLADAFSREIGRDVPGEAVCAGTFLSRAQFLVDIQHWGYRDLRAPELMSPQELTEWTAAAEEESKPQRQTG